eukprot:3618522-Rhodomonas_salina.1
MSWHHTPRARVWVGWRVRRQTSREEGGGHEVEEDVEGNDRRPCSRIPPLSTAERVEDSVAAYPRFVLQSA